MTAPEPQPGWYPDPSGMPGQRYWDGRQWSSETTHVPPRPPMQPIKQRSRSQAIIVACVLAFGGCAALAGTGMLTGNTGSNNTTSRPSATATIPSTRAATPRTRRVTEPGAVARDGQFEFQVTDVSSAKTIGDNQFLQTTAQGVFVVFTLRVTNIGDEPQNFFARNQKLIDMDGREYEASTRADMNLNDIGNLGQINPGNSVVVKVAFDVPQELQMAALELHDSLFSSGVQVAAAASE